MTCQSRLSGEVSCYERSRTCRAAARRMAKNPTDLLDARLKRLAQNIDRLAEKDERSVRRAREIRAMRRFAASTLHRLCLDFVLSVNRLLSHGEVVLDPPDYPDSRFSEDSANLIQMNVRGRILQVAFEATLDLLSTEDFRIPYTLQGSIRAFNQELLDKDLIEEQLIFYTVEKSSNQWRFFDARTYRSGPFDNEYLISLMEQLI